MHALIVSFEHTDALRRCIDAIGRQSVPVDRVTIVDNGRTRLAEEAIEDRHRDLGIEIVRLGTNVGPAGGFAEGLTRFLDAGLPYAWAMDDDCFPTADALEILLHDAAADAIVQPVVCYPGVEGNTPSWSGVVIPRSIVQDVGVPRRDFVWWFEDTEYLQWRIPAAGYRVVRSMARVDTDVPRRAKHKPAWKYYYEARNSVYYRTHLNRRLFFRRLAMRLVLVPGAIVLKERGRPRKLWMYARGVVDGLLGRLGPRVPLP